MNRGRHGIEKACIRVRSEVHDNVRRGRDRPHHLDVEHDFAVRTVRISRGGILAVIHRDRRDLGGAHVKPREVRVQVRSAISAAEFDDGNALTLTSSAWNAVQRRYLRWRERYRHRRVGAFFSAITSRPHSEMRLCLRSIIKTQDSFDDSVQLLRQLNGAGSATISAAWMGKLLQLD